MRKFPLSCKDSAYFKNYAGSGQAYNKVWTEHSYADELIELLPTLKPIPEIKKILVLGTATGKVLRVLENGTQAKTYGCEINSWAHAQIPATFRRRIKNLDMQSYVRELHRNEKSFSLVFSNSLIYVPTRDLQPLLKRLSKIAKFLHFNSSFLGHACPDPYRRILQSFDWWSAQFAKAGFVEVRAPGKRRSYLWTSTFF